MGAGQEGEPEPEEILPCGQSWVPGAPDAVQVGVHVWCPLPFLLFLFPYFSLYLTVFLALSLAPLPSLSPSYVSPFSSFSSQ